LNNLLPFPRSCVTAIKFSVEIPFTWSTNLGLYSGSRYLKESKNMFFDSLFLNLMAVMPLRENAASVAPASRNA